MPAQRKYPDELIERGVQLVMDKKRDQPGRAGIVREVGDLLGIHPEVLRHWVNKAGQNPAPAAQEFVGESERVKALEAENANLRRINAILRSAAALFAAEIENGKSIG
ncbi:transposase [Kitasatospora sp. NPDC090308]|uniref:transposase n=1 Tax=Kitasatospora sp. NPDC090308 TaxID=3364082 RepID=UPI0038018198